jgi:hypothetical protein
VFKIIILTKIVGESRIATTAFCNKEVKIIILNTKKNQPTLSRQVDIHRGYDCASLQKQYICEGKPPAYFKVVEEVN